MYFENGRYLPDALRAIDHVLRDFRAGEVRGIDRRLLDQLAALAARRGGVGFYPESDFVHPDAGRFRTWGPRPA